jgi:SPP1 gp7 family putative phage head morphogenesis protein
MVSANARLLDRAIRHAIFLEGLKASEVRAILRFLNTEAFPDAIEVLSGKLARVGRGGSALSSTRMRELVEALQASIDDSFRDAYRQVRDSMRDVSLSEGRWQANQIKVVIPQGIGIDMVAPSPVQLRALVGKEAIQGEFLREWWKDESKLTFRRVTREVRLGVTQGESIDRMVQRVRGTRAAMFSDGVLNTTRREAEAFVRTATIHYSNAARDLTYKENAGLIKGVRWVATLSLRTCPACAALDGKVFDVDGGGERPPLHPNCRCTTVPIVKSLRELGFNVGDLPEGQRATMDGLVPESTTFEEWAKSRSVAEQDEIFGKRRAVEWRAGRLDLDEMVKNGRVLSLQELELVESAPG